MRRDVLRGAASTRAWWHKGSHPGLDELGELLLILANPAAFELISRRKVGQGESWAHLAVSGDEVFVRELDGITTYRWSDSPAAPSASP